MVLSLEIKYKRGISGPLSPESVLLMLWEVRADIRRVDSSFAGVDLARVLEVVETGNYEVKGSVSTRIDLSSAKDVINEYRAHSEGNRGCQSCVSLGRETFDAQDATSGFYCQVSDPDYDVNAIGSEPRVKYSGFSAKVRKHYYVSCKDWKSKFSPNLPNLEELILKEK